MMNFIHTISVTCYATQKHGRIYPLTQEVDLSDPLPLYNHRLTYWGQEKLFLKRLSDDPEKIIVIFIAIKKYRVRRIARLWRKERKGVLPG